MLTMLALAATAAIPPCWDVFDSALRHNASAPHPAYVSYDERISVTEDRAPLVSSVAHIDYRDDGLARVRDERFDFAPIVTRHTEPGPPELGPYGPARWMWLPQEQALPIIARVRSQGDLQCSVADTETYKGHNTYHLIFSGPNTQRPSLKAMWVDTGTHDVWKVIVSGPVIFADDPGAPTALADFEVELEYVGPYLIVDHVVWSYRRRIYSQYADYFGEYTLGGFSFPHSLPTSYFATTTSSR
jgi:hypothetical protein